MPTNFVFWNIARRNAFDAVGELSHQTEADVVILAESAFDDLTMAAALTQRRDRPFRRVFSKATDVRIFTWLGERQFHAVSDFHERVVAFRLVASTIDVLVVGVHFPSRLHYRDSSIADFSRLVAAHVTGLEVKYRTVASLIVGDFNMNPFDAGMVSSFAFHAVSSASRTQREGWIVFAEWRRFFYNPMWSLMGDRGPGPPGSYFRSGSESEEFFWHTYDQVIVRPQLAPFLQSVMILDSLGEESLVTKSGRPDRRRYSDHLPLVFSLDLNAASVSSNRPQP